MIKQVAHELKNHNLYKSFANHFSVEGITDLEEFFNKRAQEEYNHHQWLYDHLSEADVKFTYPVVEANTEKITALDYLSPFVQTIDREILTTQMLYAIYDAANIEKDFMTTSWLYDQLIKEQIEEEALSRMSLKIMQEDSDIFIRAEHVLALLDA